MRALDLVSAWSYYFIALLLSFLFPSRVRAKGRVELWGEGILQMKRQSLNVVTETLPWVCSQPSSVVAKHMRSQQARVPCKAAWRPFPHTTTCPESLVCADASQSRWFLLLSTWFWNEMDFWWNRLGNSTFNYESVKGAERGCTIAFRRMWYSGFI